MSAVWDEGDLRSGLAVKGPNGKATLGVAVAHGERTYLLTARHAFRAQGEADEDVPVLRASGEYRATPRLVRPGSPRSPVDDVDMRATDVDFLIASEGVRNDTPQGLAPVATFWAPSPGEALVFRGLRHASWVPCTYSDPYTPDDRQFFDHLGALDANVLSIIRLPSGDTVDDYEGDSGATLWSIGSASCRAVGQLVGVSRAAPRALVSMYWKVQQRIGLFGSRVVGANT